MTRLNYRAVNINELIVFPRLDGLAKRIKRYYLGKGRMAK